MTAIFTRGRLGALGILLAGATLLAPPDVQFASSGDYFAAGAQSARDRAADRGNRNRPGVRGGSNVNVNHTTNNVNVDIDRRTNVRVDNRNRHHDWDDDWDDDWHPVRTIATVTAAAIVVGAVFSSLPPDCDTVIINGIRYSHCGDYWYQPQYYGSSVQYIVVTSPR